MSAAPAVGAFSTESANAPASVATATDRLPVCMHTSSKENSGGGTVPMTCACPRGQHACTEDRARAPHWLQANADAFLDFDVLEAREQDGL
ncbi:hypothetical protein GCM10027075_56640 [Streptomyces heilongjiangensis]